MTKIEIILGAILTLSIILNVGLFAYARASIVRLLSVSEELGDLHTMVSAFASHLKSVYELEMFYGDETLSHLLDHARSFNEQLETFEYVYSLTEEELNQIEQADDEAEEETQ